MKIKFLLQDYEGQPENNFFTAYDKWLKEKLIYNIREKKMAKSDALSSYMAEIVDIMQEVQLKMQRVQQIKAEMDKLKKLMLNQSHVLSVLPLIRRG